MMLGENLEVASTSSRVGYEDPSYFTRDYKSCSARGDLLSHPKDFSRLRPQLQYQFANASERTVLPVC